MLELAERVLRITGSKSSIQRIPYAQAYGEGFEDMRRRVPDLGKVRAAIGYRPRVKIDEPCVRGRTPSSIEIGRISSNLRPSTR